MLHIITTVRSYVTRLDLGDGRIFQLNHPVKLDEDVLKHIEGLDGYKATEASEVDEVASQPPGSGVEQEPSTGADNQDDGVNSAVPPTTN